MRLSFVRISEAQPDLLVIKCSRSLKTATRYTLHNVDITTVHIIVLWSIHWDKATHNEREGKCCTRRGEYCTTEKQQEEKGRERSRQNTKTAEQHHVYIDIHTHVHTHIRKHKTISKNLIHSLKASSIII